MASENSSQSPPHCANGCGFFGNPTTLNMCSKCYRDNFVQQIQEVKISPTDHVAPVEKVKPDNTTIACVVSKPETRTDKARCGRCNKRVGLLKGFGCRCGNVYCTAHRYPEEHACTFDYKMNAREMLTKSNPVIKADKLERI